MDDDDSGFISMDEFCPEISRLFKYFKDFLVMKHEGSLCKAWKKSLDLDGSGSISKEELIEAMKRLEWDGNAARIFEILDFDHSGSITLEEIDEKAFAAMQRGDDELGLDVEPVSPVSAKDKSTMSFMERQAMNANAQRSAVLGKAQRNKIAAEEKKRLAALSGATTPEEFKSNLARTYGNLFKAWKQLDLDGGGSLSFVEFCKAA